MVSEKITFEIPSTMKYTSSKSASDHLPIPELVTALVSHRTTTLLGTLAV
jgi:hypothetical protein